MSQHADQPASILSHVVGATRMVAPGAVRPKNRRFVPRIHGSQGCMAATFRHPGITLTAAFDALADRRVFQLDDQRWDAFITALAPAQRQSWAPPTACP
jgi:hypothetical protein